MTIKFILENVNFQIIIKSKKIPRIFTKFVRSFKKYSNVQKMISLNISIESSCAGWEVRKRFENGIISKIQADGKKYEHVLLKLIIV